MLDYHFSRNDARPIVYDRIKQNEDEQHQHMKVWLVKYDKKPGQNRKRLRIIISTSNLDDTGFNYGANMFWAETY